HNPASKILLCGRKDAALVACFAAAVDDSIDRVATQELLLTYLDLFNPAGQPINAASILPAMLRDFGDVADVLAAISPRQVLVSAPLGNARPSLPSVIRSRDRFSENPGILVDWLAVPT